MKKRLVFVERRPTSSPSIELVFRRVAEFLPSSEFEYEFQQLPYGDGVVNLFKNLLYFKPLPADIYHITGHSHYIALRLPRTRTILTVHDLVLLHTRSGLRRWVLKKVFFDMPLDRVRAVTAISEFTRNEILRWTGSKKEVKVIPDPLRGGLSPSPRADFNAELPLILQVGTALNKNLERLLEAVHGLRCRLHIVGRIDRVILDDLRRKGIDFVNSVNLNQDEMADAYRACDIVAFCSTYEGFGLPIIEAQAMSKPLVTSDLEPMRTVAGNGAIFVDPSRPASIRDGLDEIIGDPEVRSRIVEAGKANVARFDPRTIADAYAAIYRSIAEK